MAELFASGRIVDAIGMFMLVEYAMLVYLRKKSHRGLSAYALLTNLAAGAALLMSLRAALIRAPWHIVAIWLVLALLAHAADLRLRWAAEQSFLTH